MALSRKALSRRHFRSAALPITMKNNARPDGDSLCAGSTQGGSLPSRPHAEEPRSADLFLRGRRKFDGAGRRLEARGARSSGMAD
jgi:hypothetical protein